MLVYWCIENSSSVGVFFFEVKKAFDTVNHVIVLNKLSSHDVRCDIKLSDKEQVNKVKDV